MQMGMSIKPDFVVTGSPLDGGRVQLIASRNLTYAEMNAQYTHQDIFDDTLDPVASVRTSADFSLTTHMTRAVIIQADDYPQAFAKLAEAWASGGWRGSPAGAIEPPHRALPPAGSDRLRLAQPREPGYHEHGADGPADCRRCQLYRDNQHWLEGGSGA